MNILIINASPRKDGTVHTLLKAMALEVESDTNIVDMVEVAKLHVSPCTGCMVCRTTGKCTLAYDDSQRMLEKIRRADLIVVGAPTYWANMPGTLKVLFDRLVYGFMQTVPGHSVPTPLLPGKRVMILTVCSTPWPLNIMFGQSKGCLRAIREVFRWSGAKVVKVMAFTNPYNNSHPNRLLLHNTGRAIKAMRRELNRTLRASARHDA